ncbi:MAG TPA: HlyD family secretion protein [Desulfobacterales bacterium]|nr:HlyD family secretion protein [Desulfobacterales bacterium]
MTNNKDENVEPVSSDNNSKRKRTQKWLIVFVVIGILVGSFYGIRWLHYYFTHASTDDASVEGDLISVSSTVSGKIRQLPIREGEQVKKGQLIAQLREEDYQAQVDISAGIVQSINASLNEAMADEQLVREKTEKDLQRAEAVLSVSQARLKEAEANMQLATLDFKRVSKLYKSKTVSASEMDKVQAAYTLAQAGLEKAEEEINENRAKLKVARANTGEVTLKQRRVESLKGKLKEATAELEAAQLKLDHTTVTSPIDGVVAKKISHIGEVIKSGQPIAVIIDLNNIWVEANLEETQVEHVRLGQSVDIEVDAYPNTKFTGKVVNIGAATASQFALIPENRSAGNFTKVTQRIPIKIEVIDPAEQLRPGMMVVVGIDTWKAK